MKGMPAIRIIRTNIAAAKRISINLLLNVLYAELPLKTTDGQKFGVVEEPAFYLEVASNGQLFKAYPLNRSVANNSPAHLAAGGAEFYLSPCGMLAQISVNSRTNLDLAQLRINDPVFMQTKIAPKGFLHSISLVAFLES
jgi:hypothetical protein